jgi:hypothetical protein
MPFILFIVGLVLVVSAVRGKQDALFALLKSDFAGSGSFIPWLVSLLVIGGLGYVKSIKPITDAFLVLVIIVLFLSNGGFFAKFAQQTGIGIKGLPSITSLSTSMGTQAGSLLGSIPGLPGIPGIPSISSLSQ